MSKILVKPLPRRVWGEIGTPKGLLGTIETIPLSRNPGKPRGGPILPQSYVFRVPFWDPKRAPRPSGHQTLTLGSKNWVRGQKYQSWGIPKHAEPTGQCPKRSHMLQVMAKCVLGAGPQNLGAHTHNKFGHNLQHMAPFGAMTGGFCMSFRFPVSIFLTP